MSIDSQKWKQLRQDNTVYALYILLLFTMVFGLKNCNMIKESVTYCSDELIGIFFCDVLYGYLQRETNVIEAQIVRF